MRTPKATSLWLCTAMVEIPTGFKGFTQLIREDAMAFRLVKSVQSPRGFQWYDIMVDHAMGKRRAARTTWALLWALKRLATDGVLRDFRIVRGIEWLDIVPPRCDDEHDLPASQRIDSGGVSASTIPCKTLKDPTFKPVLAIAP